MIDKPNGIESWSNRRDLTLDIAGLSEEERREGSIFIGGSSSKFVRPGDQFNYGQVDTVLFEWGDQRAEGVFACMLEHDDRPDIAMSQLFPFAASTIVEDDLWMLAVQDKGFEPSRVYNNPELYTVLPFDKDKAPELIEEFMQKPVPRRQQLIGKVGLRWVLFEMSTKIR